MDALPGWRPDPFGLHELRFFSHGGKPTRLVSDNNFESVYASNENLNAASVAATNDNSASGVPENHGRRHSATEQRTYLC